MTGALREGGHVDAARCARRLGCLPAEGRLLERSPARPQMEPTLLVPPCQTCSLQDRPACGARLQQPRRAHTHSPPRSCKPGREIWRFLHSCLQFHKKLPSVVTWWAGRSEAEGQSGSEASEHGVSVFL